MSSFFKIGSNQRERSTLNAHGNRVDILYSYETPVATITSVYTGAGYTRIAHRTSTQHSPTTSRHINRWLDSRAKGMELREMDQSRLWALHHFVNAAEAKAAGVTV